MYNYLYHMEVLSDEEEIKEFYPRIPYDISEGENEDIDRICTSPSIRGCFSSAPWGQVKAFAFGKNMVFRVYKFNVGDINKANIITSQELYDRGLVRDALICDETWIVNQKIKPCEVFYINITDYKKSLEPLDRYCCVDEFLNTEFNLDEFLALKESNDYDSIEYTIVNKSELLFGNEIKIPIKELSRLGEYKHVKNTLVNLVKNHYMIGDIDEYLCVYEDLTYENLILEFEGFYTGIWYKRLMKELKALI